MSKRATAEQKAIDRELEQLKRMPNVKILPESASRDERDLFLRGASIQRYNPPVTGKRLWPF